MVVPIVLGGPLVVFGGRFSLTLAQTAFTKFCFPTIVPPSTFVALCAAGVVLLRCPVVPCVAGGTVRGPTLAGWIVGGHGEIGGGVEDGIHGEVVIQRLLH